MVFQGMTDRATSDSRAELLFAFRRRVRQTVLRELEREDHAAEHLRAEVLPKLRSAIAEARARAECGRAWLFGSFAWGQPTERSDVDLLVEDCPSPDGLAGQLWSACGRPAHVIELRTAPEGLVARVLGEGIAL